MVLTEAEKKDVSDANISVSTPPIPPEEPPPTMEEIVSHDVIESIVKQADHDLELIEFSSVPGTLAGDNYMSVMYAVDADVKSKSTGNTKTLHIMLKTMPRNAFRQQMINDCQAFVKDSLMYNTVFPDFIAFQKQHGLENEEIFRGSPECYASFNDGKTDYLAMENLRYAGYKMGGRVEGLDFDHCEIVMKSLAKFHAISYVKFKGDYDAIMKTYPFLEEKMFQSEEKIQDMHKFWFSTSFQRINKLMQDMGQPKEAEIVDMICRDIVKFLKTLNSLAGKKVENAVVGHGDCWTNNFLFLYDEKTGKPISLKFVDFQISRVSSRTLDLGYFIYTSIQTKVLNERKIEILRIYHDEFISFSRRLGMNEEQLEKFEDFLEEMDHFKFYGITMGLMLLPMVSASSADVPDMEKIEITPEIDAKAMDEFYDGIMKSKVAEGKILNLIKNHCNNVKFLQRE